MQETTEKVYDIGDFWQTEVLNKLSKKEKSFYDEHIYPIFSKYIIHNYYVKTENGFANLHQEPNANAKILTTIPTGTYVCFVEEAGNWVKIYYPQIIDNPKVVGDYYVETGVEAGIGYIHKSQLEQR